MKHKTALDRILHAHAVSAPHLDLTGLDIEYLPREIGLLGHLEYLDLSHNRLSTLPDEFAFLKNLKKLFLTKNDFDLFPSVIGSLSSLEMFSLKSNRIESVGDMNNIPATVNWLILTDNRISELPGDFGTHLPRLRKLALSGNRLTKLPASFADLAELELVRISSNRLESFPEEVLSLPGLAWIAQGGNPCTDALPEREKAVQHLESIRLDFNDYTLGECIGSGASGTVYHASSRHTDEKSAVKIFKPVSSDGRPEDELAVCSSVVCSNDIPGGLIPVRGWFEQPLGLVMDYIDNADSLAGVPSLASISRDVYRHDASFSAASAVSILLSCAQALEYIHAKNVCHGDFYAHNILIQENGSARLGDWGASFFYPREHRNIEKIEVRSFGILAEELNLRIEGGADERLSSLAEDCMKADVSTRPVFSEIKAFLEEMK